MFRTSDVLMIAVMLTAAAFTYQTKHDAEAKYEALREIEMQTTLEEDTIDVLKADWSLLTQPSRLQRLVEVYQDELGLVAVEAPQIAEFRDLPERPLTIDALVADLASFEVGRDQTVTGSVKP